MKKLLFSLAAVAMLFAACNPNNPENTDPVGTTYPRVQVIEHFTGADCGYCPFGMDCIDEVYAQNPDGYVWVSNHYGYGTDEYYIKESATIGKKLKVSGAPNISMNRTKLKFDATSSYSYHPYYTAQADAQMEKTATEKIELTRTYENGNLHVKATILTSREDLVNVKFTLGITESGSIGKQADYYGSWEGWTKFTHTHTIRAYATQALGDDVELKKRVAIVEYDIAIDPQWAAENCEIIAWVTDETCYNILNAAKLPVVEGTQGGENIRHGGIEAVPVDDDYPEKGSPATEITLTQAEAQYQSAGDGNTIFQLVGVNLENNVSSFSYYGTTYSLYPYFDLVLYVEGNVATIPVGEYPIVAYADDITPNCVVAGLRNDAQCSLDWSKLYYIYQDSDGLYIYSQWLLDTGVLNVTENGFTLTTTTKNGSQVSATYTGTISCSQATSNAPKKLNTHKNPLSQEQLR